MKYGIYYCTLTLKNNGTWPKELICLLLIHYKDLMIILLFYYETYNNNIMIYIMLYYKIKKCHTL